MIDDALLRGSLATLEVDDTFTEAIVFMCDGSKLRFCHRVGERWIKAEGIGDSEQHANLADRILPKISLFRLNTKHLDIQFQDGSRWEAPFRDPRTT